MGKPENWALCYLQTVLSWQYEIKLSGEPWNRAGGCQVWKHNRVIFRCGYCCFWSPCSSRLIDVGKKYLMFSWQVPAVQWLVRSSWAGSQICCTGDERGGLIYEGKCSLVPQPRCCKGRADPAFTWKQDLCLRHFQLQPLELLYGCLGAKMPVCSKTRCSWE